MEKICLPTDKSYAIMLIFIGILMILFVVIIIMTPDNFCATKDNLYSHPDVIERFSKLQKFWYQISKDKKLLSIAKKLMQVNSDLGAKSTKGSQLLYDVFSKLDQYVKKNVPKTIRVTFIYTDGIVFYDSAIPMHKIYFFNNGLPQPVSMFTLGSPLKDHNTLPEVVNSIVVSYADPKNISGKRISNPFYTSLLYDGFGFYERRSSSLGIPYTYLARFIPLSDQSSSFVDGCTLRVSTPVPLDNKPIQIGRI